jgi:hypothetical protein
MMAHCTILVFGQEQGKSPPKAEALVLSATPRMDPYQVIDRVRRLSQEAQGLEPKEEEIRLQAGLADCVWAMDQLLGQRLLLRSFDLTVASLKQPRSSINPVSNYTDPNLLFRQISSIAARHDAKLEKQLAQSWQDSLASSADKSSEPKTDPAQLSYLLLRQSASYLGNDAQKARALFRQSVYLRVLPAHCFFLMSQRKHAVEVTDLLFSDALDVLAQRQVSEANDILLFSSYLFSPDGSISYLSISGYNAANAAGNSSTFPRNPALARRYLGLLLAKLNPAEAVPPAVVYFALKNLVAQYQALAPELLTDVYGKMASLGPGVSKDDAMAFGSAYDDLNASGTDAIATWEKRLENADNINNEGRRDLEYFTIILGYLLPKKDFTRAAIVVNRIGNQDLKQGLTDFLKLSFLQARLETPETGSSLSDIDCNQIKQPLLKVIALSSVAQTRTKQKATGEALRLLDQAMGEAKHIDNDQDRLQAKLMLVQLYLAADSSMGFDAAVMTFKEINKCPNFDMRRSSFSVKVTVYGLSNELPVGSPLASSLTSAVGKMCHINCIETLDTCGLLEEKNTMLWATFEAVRTALLASAKGPTAAQRDLRR